METDATKFNSAAPFNNHARIQTLDAAAGNGATRIGDLPELKNHFGTVHGGALYTVGEVAAARAVLSALGEHIAHLHAVTRSARIRYLKAARGAIDARATLSPGLVQEALAAVEQQGHAEVTVEVALTDAQGIVVATMVVDWHIGRPRTA